MKKKKADIRTNLVKASSKRLRLMGKQCKRSGGGTGVGSVGSGVGYLKTPDAGARKRVYMQQGSTEKKRAQQRTKKRRKMR